MLKRKLRWVFVLLVPVTFICIQELPVKQAISPKFDYIPKGEIPLGEIEIICEHSDTSGADWLILGYNNHLFPSANGYMYVEGVDPMNELSENITIYDYVTERDKKNRFVIKGVLEKREGPDYNEYSGNLVLVSKGWEIVSPISRGDDIFRPFALKSYLTKGDFKSSE
ncbi:hypothetical protein [Aneurinibacillus uraniidurans]|uniref:hypothetical protein n=1 Tax=Aneurinibacillus uraniidurans TaxID=2966586 RepID=UPI00234AC818|nr:hypothetical protein [Aneurinibacillus sp. B1]WCN36799.1 hypothetical protein PO771_13100 [Aneurinibacillus sp. B1]